MAPVARCLTRTFKTPQFTQCATKNHQHRAAFHLTSTAKDMVAPPDPVSHMRPIIYDDPPVPQPDGAYVRHPYSLSEFESAAGGGGSVVVGDNELQFKLLRQRLDALHQNFWLDSNTRFYSAKQSVLNNLPETATVRDKEQALSVFYKKWVMQEKELTDAYTNEWRRRNTQLIALSARVEFAKLKGCVSSFLKSS
ncbi:hypothetical protein BDN70DRAFT_995546 [Pholiota conissans]|uniref:Uncharacterized protein n=1 Tax=Pholiota conissans TaxID=109636 RepID=A0A9P5YVN6_9AGAR|nr:hypothetical protein BDN70DRAFT_995546 [Pholiota conissans]